MNNIPNPYITHANQLRAEATDIVMQIRAAENGNRLEYEKFCALLHRKNAIIAEANRMISEINHTLNMAARSPHDRLPYLQYKELKDARKLAREIVDLVHSPHAPNQSIPNPTPAPAAIPISDFDWLDDDDDYQLPF